MPSPLNTHEKTLRDAIRELANEVGGRQFDTTVTADEAAERIDHDLVVAWATVETSKRSPGLILSEAFENLTDAEAFAVLTCLLNETDTARKLLAHELRQYIARDLAYSAQTAIDNTVPDEPVRSTRYSSLARGFAASGDDGWEQKRRERAADAAAECSR